VSGTVHNVIVEGFASPFGPLGSFGADPELVAALQHGVVPEFFHIPEPYDYGELLLEGERLTAREKLRDHYLSIEAIRVVDKLKYLQLCFHGTQEFRRLPLVCRHASNQQVWP